MNYTDTQLQLALAKMLPEHLQKFDDGQVWWHYPHGTGKIRITEWLHICWLVEESLDLGQHSDFKSQINEDVSATWQQRAIALAEVKGVEIV